MAQIIKGYVETSGGQIHYRMTGASCPGLPLVLLHQNASSSVMYEAIMGQLADQFRILAPDLPGMGGSFSMAERPSISFYAQIMVESLQAMDISECWLFGHHTGSAVAVQMIYDHPNLARKMILCGPTCLSSAQKKALQAGHQPMVIRTDGRHLIRVWEHIRRRDPEAPLSLSHREALHILQSGDAYHQTYAAVLEHDFARQLATISCPILVMAGELDVVYDSLASSYALLQNGTMRSIPNAGGYICDRQYKLVASIVREFFSIDER